MAEISILDFIDDDFADLVPHAGTISSSASAPDWSSQFLPTEPEAESTDLPVVPSVPPLLVSYYLYY